MLEGDEFSHQLIKMADYAGNTAMHLAAVGPAPEVLRELLVRGGSVHARNLADNTPLYLAEKTGRHADCARLLREAGAHLWVAERGGTSSKTSAACSTVGDGDDVADGQGGGSSGVVLVGGQAARNGHGNGLGGLSDGVEGKGLGRVLGV